MNWRTDPPNGWTAIYRIVVLVFLAYCVWANASNPNVPDVSRVVETVINGATWAGS